LKKRFFLLCLAVFAVLAPLSAQNQPQGDNPDKPAYTPVDETQLLIDTPAADGTENPGENDEPVRVPGLEVTDFLKMLFFLGLMILLIYGFFLLLRKMSGRSALQSGLINVRGSRILKGDSVLHIVEIGQKILVVGTAGQSVSLITEITDRETIDEIRLNTPQAPASGGMDFVKKLAARLKMPVSEKDPGESAVEGAEFIKKQRDRLKGL
jgi:flagellar protein FliO/FliZ